MPSCAADDVDSKLRLQNFKQEAEAAWFNRLDAFVTVSTMPESPRLSQPLMAILMLTNTLRGPACWQIERGPPTSAARNVLYAP
jgi:hypothetical protein